MTIRTMPPAIPSAIFGTYKLQNAMLELALRQALEAGVTTVDTAVLYRNLEAVAEIVRDYPAVRVNVKVHRRKHLAVDLEHAAGLFGAQLGQLMLHRSMGIDAWKQLIDYKASGRVGCIGVSNVSIAQLEELLEHGVPDVVQNELHPFIESPVPAACKARGIRFEAHSVMTCHDRLQPIAEAQGVSTAQVAMAYCLQQGLDVCFSTTCYEHLCETLAASAVVLTNEQMTALSHLHLEHTEVRYGWQGEIALEEDHCVAQLQDDIAAHARGEIPSRLCIRIGKTFGSKNALPKRLAKRLFPELANPDQRFDQVLKGMRRRVHEHSVASTHMIEGAACCVLGRAEEPHALPVVVPSGEVFDPILDALGDAEGAEYSMKFARGALFADGRLDLCKQVVQPRFVELCEAVASNPRVRHFLIGNNLAFDKSENVDAFVRLLQTDPEIETWYLAGNCIDGRNVGKISEALESATHMRSLWLKMNPLKNDVAPIARLLSRHSGLELIDLFNTGLCDTGVTTLANEIEGATTTKHVYLCINAITANSCGALDALLGTLPQLESLFVSVNRLGDSGMKKLLASLRRHNHSSLKRLAIGSNGLSDDILGDVQTFVEQMPALISLDLGSYRSTKFFQEKQNCFTDERKLMRLANSGQLQHLGLNYCYQGANLDTLIAACEANAALSSSVCHGGGGKVIRRVDLESLQRITSPASLRHIESIYRTAM